MLLMGDEIGWSKNGNNNIYCYDLELNWLNWEFLEINVELFRFVKNCVVFWKVYFILKN